MAICKYCKHVSADGTPFCKECGKPLDVIPQDVPEVSSGLPPVGGTASQPVGGTPTQPVTGTQYPPVNEVPLRSGDTGGGVRPQQNTANTFPMNEKDRQAYAEETLHPGRPDNDGICVLALVFGMISIVFNPLLLNSILALILGIVGHACGGPKKDIAKLGWILGLISLIVYVVIGLVFSILTIGLLWWLIQLFI
ncbi:MAG: hypothetical protein IKH92_05560 [Clostridiales bacterium]|nr:hypothetical protein [Clostridiales bacterium]